LLVASPTTTWGLSDLTNQLFFNFTDLKPGDQGEDTISLHVDNNDSYACMDITLTGTPENGQTEPETEDGDTTADQGELQNELNFAFWADDGDNVYETGETIFKEGTAASLFAADNAKWALADSQTNVWTGQAAPLPGNSVRYIAKYWCFGDLTKTPVTQDNASTTNPLIAGTGFTCSGASSDNTTQTDGMTADVSFEAVQSRNNSAFVCGASTPNGETRQKVGANLTAYSAPIAESCNVTVDDTGGNPALDTIQEGVNAATAGQTVCVKAGTYTEDVNVNKSITLAGDGASLVTLTGVGTGEAGALVVTADNVTVKGFKVIGTGVSALRISGARTGDTFSYNHAIAATGKNALLMDGGQSNHTVSNNVLEGNATGSQIAYVNGLASVNVASTNVDFTNNTFGGTANMALGQEAGASAITQNKFSTVTSFTDVEDWKGGNNYNQNNFNDAGLNLQHSENGNTGDNGITNAENNWWGDADPSDGDVNLNVDVDFTPSEASAFPEN